MSPLAAMEAVNQWICWRSEPHETKPDRVKKIPTHPQTGGNIDAHDSRQWMSYAQALAWARHAGLGLGFVFNALDPFFFVDLDECRDGAGWNATAQQICGAFQGAAMEVSVSGRGLHIFGQYTVEPDHSSETHIGGLYTRDRFVALGTGATGNVATQCDAALQWLVAAYFPPREQVVGGWTTEPVPEWTGARFTDDEIIERALRSGSAATAFGDTASFKELWEADADALERAFPDPNRTYDASRADAALASRLAFWTGKNCEHVERLMWRSGLARDKWSQRTDGYLRAQTIAGAVAACTSVYSRPEPTQAFELPPPAPGRQMGTHPLTDAGSAERILDLYGADLRYAKGVGWLQWDGVRWEPSDPPHWTAVDVARRLKHMGQELGGFQGEEICKWAHKGENTKPVESALKAAAAHPSIRVDVDDLDKDPFMLNCLNGLLDLRTGELRPHTREALCTKVAGVHFDPSARAPRFEQFLSECFEGDAELGAYVRRFLGFCLTGSVAEHVLGVWHGAQGRNGKGTLIRAMLNLLGDYGSVLAPDVLLARRGSQHPTALMDLRGQRFVACNETPENASWNEALIKVLTGGDAIRARAMRKDFVEFEPSHKLILATNAPPKVREQGNSFWTRVHLVPWSVSFLGREDRKLDDKLRDEGPGILNLLLEGCRQWLANGMELRPSTAIVAATADYKKSQDLIGQFVDEHLVADPDGWIERTPIYNDYRMWAMTNGEKDVMPASAFHRALADRGFVARTRRGTRGWFGWARRSADPTTDGNVVKMPSGSAR